MKGKLRDFALADLIQQNCLDQKTAKLIVRYNRKQAELYFKGGNLVHAQFEKQEGETVVYHLMTWEDGDFELQFGKEPPKISIQRNWSGILLDAARQIDEGAASSQDAPSVPPTSPEKQDIRQILQEMSEQVDGYLASAVIAVDGSCKAEHFTSRITPAAIAPLMTQLLKLVDTAVSKLNAGQVEDDVVTTENACILMRYLPAHSFYLIIIAERTKSSLGNMRLVARTYANKIHVEEKPTAQCLHLAICPFYKRKFPIRDAIYSQVKDQYCQANYKACEIFTLIEEVLAAGIPIDVYTHEIQSMVAGD
ncbi:MAG: DUF4388 domain-containing protein [Chloroflexota bacterium]